MNLRHTRVQHEGAGNWVVDFIGDDGEAVSVKVREHKLSNQDEVVEQAKRVMIELTGFGTRGGKPPVNRYDALSNGDLEAEVSLPKITH
ncbi:MULTISPECIES: hypothetical protein [Rhizobium]|uniref:Uncharacterized protein n=1 Tax=Rhizobium wenxiniae TaxID=1737357 RepID=A0A7W9YB50_9HYPH|nr:hypothetical protein [Rhizobium wenxiniae]MBB6164708.1 hypothetical protein [Rhizobium wenxiniae]GGG06360.1 hypothetical protein GCM10010924_38780 [Rhizobium wenxiniae]